MSISAMGSAYIFRRVGNAAQCVFTATDRFKMFRVYATRISTEVVNYKPCGDGANEQFIAQSVNLVVDVIIHETAIAFLV